MVDAADFDAMPRSAEALGLGDTALQQMKPLGDGCNSAIATRKCDLRL